MPSIFDSSDRGRFEYCAPEQHGARQNQLLREHVAYLAQRSKFYAAMFAEHEIDPDDIKTTADLHNLPFTVKDDLAANAAKFLCVDQADVIDYSLTSGTTGEPVAMLQTERDLERVGFNEEVSFRVVGVDSSDLHVPILRPQCQPT